MSNLEHALWIAQVAPQVYAMDDDSKIAWAGVESLIRSAMAEKDSD
jgi:hypothetical protein